MLVILNDKIIRFQFQNYTNIFDYNLHTYTYQCSAVGKAPITIFLGDFSQLCLDWCTALHYMLVKPYQYLRYGPLVVFVCSHIALPHHHHLCRRIWRYWLSKILVRYTVSSVYLRLSHLSQLPFMQCMGLRVFGLPRYLLMIVRISVLYLNVIIK